MCVAHRRCGEKLSLYDIEMAGYYHLDSVFGVGEINGEFWEALMDEHHRRTKSVIVKNSLLFIQM